jgi:arsenical pump membrane protein
MAVLAVGLLVLAVGGALVRPWGLPAWAAPAIAALIALSARVVSFTEARESVRPLAAPLAFVVFAVPLAALLDGVGVFEELARLAARTPRVVGTCWIIAACVVAFLNLDAAVVLLTPLYIRTAHNVGLDPMMLAFQPVLLAMLASSVLPISNLTNLIVASHFSLTSSDFLAHLLLPSVVATAVGWFAYRFVYPGRPTVVAGRLPVDRRALSIGGSAIGGFLMLLVGGERVGLPAWVAAFVVVAALVVTTRSVPWRRVPVGTVLLAAALAVVAGGVAAELPHLLSSAGDGGVRGFGTGVIAANGLNNLPAALLSVRRVVHVSRVWPLLLGLNLGPMLVITGSLASLLWQASARAAGVRVGPGSYSRVGFLVGVPAMAAVAVLVWLL